MVAAGVADEMLFQISYAIGVAEPVSIYVNTNDKSHVGITYHFIHWEHSVKVVDNDFFFFITK